MPANRACIIAIAFLLLLSALQAAPASASDSPSQSNATTHLHESQLAWSQLAQAVADKDYQRALTLNASLLHQTGQETDRLLLQRTVLLYFAEDYDAALATCNRLLFEHPTSHFADKARAFLPTLEIQAAAPTLEEAFATPGFYGGHATTVVDSYLKAREYREALGWINAALNYDGDHHQSLMLRRVIVLYRLEDYEGALETCKRLAFEYPGDAYAEKAIQIIPKIEAKVREEAAKSRGE